MPQQVVVISQHSLLIDGVISQIRERPESFELVIIEFNEHSDTLTKLLSTNPAIIIVDVLDQKSAKILSVSFLLMLFPFAKIIPLKLGNDKVQVFMSKEWQVHESQSLLSIFEEAIVL